MSRHATDVQDSVQDFAASPPLPADHVLYSGSVLFPGAFDQHGCPLIMFPVDGQAKLSSELSKAEVVDFINYFLCLHKKKQEKDSLVSLVADLRHASPHTTRFIAETLLLLELHRRTVHTVYIIQPIKKDVVKLMLKVLAPSSKSYATSFKKVLLKEVCELSNYIDRSQLLASLGGYLIYCHQSWVAFIKEIDRFVQEFLSVVQRLPSSISTLQALSRLPLPSTFRKLQDFCSTNEVKFLQLRRELGLDELLRHCECVVEKLRYPEKEPCYQAMAGTPLFTHTFFDMLQNHSRITAAVEKVEQLWQQAFSKARLQLQVFQLREDALQITEQIETLLQKRLQPYKMEVAKDAAKAGKLVTEFETSIHTPAMALVRCAEDVIHTLAEILPFESQTRERWVLDLERLKEKLHSAVQLILQTLRAVSNYHQHYNKTNRWYTQVLCENFLQELLSDIDRDDRSRLLQRRNWGTIPAWKQKLSIFLKKNPPPHMEELVHLAHLSNVIPDVEVQHAGKRMSQRCMTLRKLLISSGPVAVTHLQLALRWQYELLRSSHGHHFSAGSSTHRADVQDPRDSNMTKCETGKETTFLGTSPSTVMPVSVSAQGKPPSLSSFDSGFDGAGSSPLEALGGRERAESFSRLTLTRDTVRPAVNQAQIHKGNIFSLSDSEENRGEFDTVGNSSRASVQIIPKVTADSLNFEIKVKRSTGLPNNPWLSLPVDDLENSYTVTITQNTTPQKRQLQSSDSSDPRSLDELTQTEVQGSTQPRGPGSHNWIMHSQSSLEDSELSPISKVLSSTITDGRDQSGYTIEGIPTLLWDSFDLHNLNQDSVKSEIDLSLKDWDLKEQEGLREVEKILDKTGEILEEEENVLAQEAVLDALLKSEDRHGLWPVWDNVGHLDVLSSSELAEAGVLGLEDYFEPAESENLSEPRSTGSTSEAKVSTDGHRSDASTGADVIYSRPDLLTELQKVEVLDKLIMEENLKIHELKCYETNPKENLSGSKPSVTNQLLSKGREREAFRDLLEREKREVEKLEKSLDQQCKAKHKDRARKVVKCSIMDKAITVNRADQALCNELLSSICSRPESSHLAALMNHNSQYQTMCETDGTQAELSLEVVKEDIPQDLDHCPNSRCPEAFCPKAELSVLKSSSDVEDPSEEVRLPSQDDMNKNESDGVIGICKPEATTLPETRPDDGAFDPGGKSNPSPFPSKTLPPVNCDFSEHETHFASDLLDSVAQDPTLTDYALQDNSIVAMIETVTVANGHVLFANPNVKQQNNNNNNHTLPENENLSFDWINSSGGSTKEGHMSVAPVQMELPQKEEVEASSKDGGQPHDVPPNLPLEFDPGGGDELEEDLPDGLQNSDLMRISSSGSPVVQAQYSNIREVTDFKTPVVLDTGSGLMKAGFADQDLPNIIFPTIIGQPKYEEIMNGDFKRETYIGHEAQHMRGVLALKHPMKNGIICNWDEMERIWHHTFQQLCVDSDDHPVLLTEAAMNPLKNRQRMVEVMFECFNVPFTYVAMQAVLALHAAGRCTGVVFDSGDGVSHSVPVCEGYCLPHAVQRFPLAGGDVTVNLKRLLQEQGVCMRTSAEMEIVREMKEKCCCVALDYEAELTGGGSSGREMHYTMPDGQIVTLSTERFRAPEILFKPELIGRDHYGVHESIFKSILSSDIDLRRCFLGNIVLSGGNTLLPGLPQRLQAEIQGLAALDVRKTVCVTCPEDRDFSVWRGGAALANLHSFSSAWISQEEYEDFGPQIVFRKCF